MAKKKRIISPKKPKKSGLIYFFLIPVLFLAVYVAGQPQSYIQEAGSNKEKKAQDAGGGDAAPTFTQLGDCTANQNCPTPDPAVGADQPEQAGQQPQEDKKAKGGKKKSKSGNDQLIARIKDLLKQLTNGKCEGLANKIGANSVVENDIESNHGKWHRRKKWHKKKRGLWKLLKCLKKNTKKQQGQPAAGGTTEPSQAPVDQPQEQQPSEAPAPSEPAADQGQQPSAAPAGGDQATANAVSGECGTVVSKAQLLNDTLQIGSANGLWSNQTKTQSSCGFTSKKWSGSDDATKYWCTYLIVDAYNLAGFKGLSVGEHAAVVTMRSWWKSASGYIHVENNNDQATITAIGPGYAIFMETEAGVFTGKEHVNFIKTIAVDDRGNGAITTLDSNAKVKGRTYTITGWKVTGTSYPVRGFGGH